MIGSGGEPGKTSVVTVAPGGGYGTYRWLGTLGHVVPPTYSYALPGGCNTLTCVLEREATYRSDALNPGRIVYAYRGGSPVWKGVLLEPVYGTGGWQITANGEGNLGSTYQAVYTTWSNQNDAINQAITRGLPWTNPGVPSGVWLGQQQDSGVLTITDLLNLFCTKGGYTWSVVRGVLSVYLWQTSPVTRILTCVVPAPRSLGGDTNVIYGRYTSAADAKATPQVSSLTSVSNAVSIAEHGRIETYDDLSNAGVLTAGAAQAQLQNKLNLYQRASFSGPFSVRYGELLTAGGQAVDLGCEIAGSVVKLILMDYGYGGEVVPDPVTFVVGDYEYNDSTAVATITPFQSLDLSLSGLLGTLGLAGGTAEQEKPGPVWHPRWGPR